MYIFCNKGKKIIASSTHKFKNCQNIWINNDVIGGYLNKGKNMSKNHIAMICNWKQHCGISTYTEYLVKSLRNMGNKVTILSEISAGAIKDDNAIYCWKRGESLKGLCQKITDVNADFYIVQHEFGIFPNACYFLQLLQKLNNYPYAVVLHSVYEHLDKTICSSAIKNIIVHSEQAKGVLKDLKHNHNKIFVLTHGCIENDKQVELWNIFKNPYTIIQFGFGFHYKGVDRAIKAIHHLKTNDSKFANIFYCYLCSESQFNKNIHDSYHDDLLELITNLDLLDNVAIIRGFQDEQIIKNYLSTAKLAIFPYVMNDDNVVYGASGAVRFAMSCNIPIIASDSHLFDDLEGVIPRPKDHLELANEIDSIFSNDKKKTLILDSIRNYRQKYSWDNCAKQYQDVISEITNNHE